MAAPRNDEDPAWRKLMIEGKVAMKLPTVDLALPGIVSFPLMNRYLRTTTAGSGAFCLSPGFSNAPLRKVLKRGHHGWGR
jgi:hypothetical protein